MQVAIDSATPLDDAAPGASYMDAPAEPYGAYGGPMRNYGRLYGSLDFNDVSMPGVVIELLYGQVITRVWPRNLN